VLYEHLQDHRKFMAATRYRWTFTTTTTIYKVAENSWRPLQDCRMFTAAATRLSKVYRELQMFTVATTKLLEVHVDHSEVARRS
jgi:hypothetical protein